MQSKFVQSQGIQIYTESFGDTTNPAMLLVMGATAQGVMWKDSFCNALAAAGLFVIRYDHRDTGKSSKLLYEYTPYYLRDLTLDAIAVLDAYNIGKATFCGASMGSFICQMAALDFPDRVEKLICIMSSPNHLVFVKGFEGRDTTSLGLPGSNSGILQYYQAILDVKATTAEEAQRKYTEMLHQTMYVPERLAEVRIFEGRILKRLKSKYHIHNHAFALAKSCDLHEDLKNIKQPTLVIHGVEDYVLPIEHGRALAAAISDAQYIEYEDMGHYFTDAIFAHLAQTLPQFVLR